MEKKVMIDGEELTWCIQALETRLGIEITEKDIEKPEIVIGELIKIFIKKIPLCHSSDCTNQQVFYILREFVIGEKPILKEQIHAHSNLSEWIPRETRRQMIEKIEDRFQIKLKVLTYKTAIHVLIGSILGLGVLGGGLGWISFKVSLLFFFFGAMLTQLPKTEFVPQTLGDFVRVIVRDHYRILRNQKGCFNPKEVEKMIFSMICDSIGLEEGEEINLETSLSW
jgi:hypothetical protein